MVDHDLSRVPDQLSDWSTINRMVDLSKENIAQAAGSYGARKLRDSQVKGAARYGARKLRSPQAKEPES